MKNTARILSIIGAALIVLLILAVVLANTKSPESSKNYLSYLVFHSKSWPCQIINQSYHEEKTTDYQQECVDRVCAQKFPGDGSGIRDLQLFSQGLCKGIPNSTTDPELIECATVTTEKVADYPGIKGQQEKYYYFAVPILRESCPENYKI